MTNWPTEMPVRTHDNTSRKSPVLHGKNGSEGQCICGCAAGNIMWLKLRDYFSHPI
jgi:hypothetical protein